MNYYRYAAVWIKDGADYWSHSLNYAAPKGEPAASIKARIATTLAEGNALFEGAATEEIIVILEKVGED